MTYCPTCQRQHPVPCDCEATRAALAEMTDCATRALDLLQETTRELERIFRNLGSVGNAKITRKARAYLDGAR
jgi:hypothetical protein